MAGWHSRSTWSSGSERRAHPHLPQIRKKTNTRSGRIPRSLCFSSRQPIRARLRGKADY